MRNYIQKKTDLLFPVILVAGLCFVTRNLQAQRSPEPVEGIMAGQAVNSFRSPEPGLLFYLSGNEDFTADFASGGQVPPNFLRNVSIVPDGVQGPGFSAADNQLLSYWAPGNVYAQRGTLSFFWRSRYPVGPTPFPVFRIGYADHSSWDMVWLRIDYNGSGFDAFVTDIGLARTRVSYFMDRTPEPDEWIHLALSWDETVGVKFYVNGTLVASQSSNHTIYDAGLDQFGPHSRIISPYQVQSAYSFRRGGDLDELKIYDRMLPDESIADLSECKTPRDLPPFHRDLGERRWRDEWWLRHGWNLPNQPPPVLPSSETSVRKVEIHDAVDIKRWYWKANDGIRETTWPGVYNMSRLPGRYDYFVLPDWDCYSGSGQSVRFIMPDEEWNHVEIWGKAWGQLTFESDMQPEHTFGVRSRQQIKSYHRLPGIRSGGTIRFDNALIEEPIGSFDVYYVDSVRAPEGRSEAFTLVSAPQELKNKALDDLAAFVRGRYPADERTMMLGVTPDRGKYDKSEDRMKSGMDSKYAYPLIHILIPYSDQPDVGLDGIELQFPGMDVAPTHNGVFPMNIRVKDPLWAIRDLADFSFSVEPGDSPTLWIDTRDRILPEERALYITLAGAGSDLTPELLTGTRIKMVYKSREEARKEHEMDRFTQIRDLYAHIVEEHPRSPRLNLYNRIMADCNDLLSVNPDHWLAQTYRYAVTGRNKPAYELPDCPEGIPEWAFLQIEYLRHLERIISYYIDKRQIANGEFGGGLSDDGDLTNMWPGIAFLGIEPDKILNSLRLHMSAYTDQKRDPFNSVLRQRSLPLFTNGLATIFTDELHALEEGIQVVGQLQLLDYGNPAHIEQAMETALRLVEDVTQINAAGHRHFRSRYYGSTRMAAEDPWQWTVNRSYLVLQSTYLLARYNGIPKVRQLITEMADGLLEHYRDGYLYTEINFPTDSDTKDGEMGTGSKPWPLMYAAYQMTGNGKYLEPLPEQRPEKRVFDPGDLVRKYNEQIVNLGIREYINTEGSIWIDRISSFNPVIQEDRLGGTALTRTNVLYPQHFVSWRFIAPASYESVAAFVSRAGRTGIEMITYNLEERPVTADVTVWDITPGRWRVKSGIDMNDDRIADSIETDYIVELERGEALKLVLAPRQYNIVSLEMIEPAEKGYWERPDLGIGPGDIRINGNSVTVRVHSLGSLDTPATLLELKDTNGNVVGTAPVPPLEAPLDLRPRWEEVTLCVLEGTDLTKGSVEIDPEGKITQITRKNTMIKW